MRTVEIQRLIRLLDIYYSETRDNRIRQTICLIKEANTGPRRAGRKPKYSKEMQEMILSMYENRLTMRQISDKTGCSLGYIQKLIKSNRISNKKTENHDIAENLFSDQGCHTY